MISRACVALWLAAATAVGCGNESAPAATAATETATPEQITVFLSGLAEGDPIEGGWAVVSIAPPRDERLSVTLEHLDSGIRIDLWITPHNALEEHAPLATDEYDVYYSSPSPRDARIAPPLLRAALADLRSRIDPSAPVPPGLVAAPPPG